MKSVEMATLGEMQEEMKKETYKDDRKLKVKNPKRAVASVEKWLWAVG